MFHVFNLSIIFELSLTHDYSNPSHIVDINTPDLGNTDTQTQMVSTTRWIYSFMFDFISILFSWESISESATFSDNHQYSLSSGPFFAPLERSTHWVPVKGWILKNTLFWGLTRGHGVQFLYFWSFVASS